MVSLTLTIMDEINNSNGPNGLEGSSKPCITGITGPYKRSMTPSVPSGAPRTSWQTLVHSFKTRLNIKATPVRSVQSLQNPAPGARTGLHGSPYQPFKAQPQLPSRARPLQGLQHGPYRPPLGARTDSDCRSTDLSTWCQSVNPPPSRRAPPYRPSRAATAAVA